METVRSARQSLLECCRARESRTGHIDLGVAAPGDRVGDARLVLVGRFDDKDYAERLRRLARELGVSDFVLFAGYRENALPFTANADAFPLTSTTDRGPPDGGDRSHGLRRAGRRS
jgi:hypothetical protein